MDKITKGVIDLLVEGHSRGNVADLLAEQGVTDPAAAIKRAIAEIEKAVTIPRDLRRAWCLEAYREVYRRLLKAGDYAGACRAVKEYASLAELPRTDQPPAQPAARTTAKKRKVEPRPVHVDQDLAELLSLADFQEPQ